MDAKVFDPVSSELQAGINLLEASAGTGKTYAIVMLVLRFVVERGVDIRELLVVTFTKAATEELKNRIRSRLAEAKQALNGVRGNVDATLLNWLDTSPLPDEVVRKRLAQALLDIDQASIFTIHGFCQRILREHALASGQLFDCELTGDITAIKQACADDFWRRTLYQRSAWEVAILIGEYRSPDELLNSINFITEQQPVYPESIGLDTLFAELRACTQVVARSLNATMATIKTALGEGKFKPSFTLPEDISPWLTWLNELNPVTPDFSCLTRDGLLAGLNGHKFRRGKKNPLSSDEQKARYLSLLGIDSEPFQRVSDKIAQIRLHFRLALLQSMREQLGKTLQHQNLLSFDDLITRLASALQGEKGHLLVTDLQQRYQSALIDEFQDTDQNQWFIFSTLFTTPLQSLYLIGDPKQAIYKFRGADIYSYLRARRQAQHRFNLGQNWRSHPHLVHAVNHLFQRPAPFLVDDLDFVPVEPARSVEDGGVYRDGMALEPLVLWQLAANEGKHEYWTSGKAALAIRNGVISEVVDLLMRPTLIINKDAEQRLQAGDIAILVRTNTQAREYQQVLAEVGVASVLNCKESVFASPQAQDLYTVLLAVSQPGNIPMLKQALTVSWFNLNGQQLYQIGNDETALDGWIARFQNYLQHWQQNDLMSMAQQLFRQEKVAITLSRQPQAERVLTDLHHSLELLQQAAIDEHLGVNKTLDWLHHAITETAQGNDEQQLRLESDEDAVRIITMHSAKGLEYPVVFCPCLWQRSDRLKKEKNIIKCHQDGHMVADLGSAQFEQRKEQALHEELAEDLRLFYVAVTRAKYRCYINWADVRTQQQANDSAMAYLLDFARDDFAAQQQKLQRYSDADNRFVAYRLLAAESVIIERHQAKSASKLLTYRQRRRSLFSHWQMSSYTALSSLSLHEAPELPADKADEHVLSPETDVDNTQLPKGAHTGNVLHDLLEHISFAAIAAGVDISSQRDKACLHYGLTLGRPELIDAMLQNVVSTPLSSDPGFCLQHIPDRQCLKEMPFYLSVHDLDATQINAILRHCPAFQPLSSRQLSGYLTGFIDLICQYDGRYYVMDYKSNSLDDYQADSLTSAMREHNYGLQYWIYTLVLHRYLQQRLPDYDYGRHFGGVKYLFMRGMSAAATARGVFSDYPALRTIEELEGLFFRD